MYAETRTTTPNPQIRNSRHHQSQRVAGRCWFQRSNIWHYAHPITTGTKTGTRSTHTSQQLTDSITTHDTGRVSAGNEQQAITLPSQACIRQSRSQHQQQDQQATIQTASTVGTGTKLNIQALLQQILHCSNKGNKRRVEYDG